MAPLPPRLPLRMTLDVVAAEVVSPPLESQRIRPVAEAVRDADDLLVVGPVRRTEELQHRATEDAFVRPFVEGDLVVESPRRSRG